MSVSSVNNSDTTLETDDPAVQRVDAAVEVVAGADIGTYETQYFGFTPKSFYNGIYNAVSENIFTGLGAMEAHFVEECADVMTPSEIHEAMSGLRSKVELQINKAFDTLEVYLDENIFKIPAQVVLPGDKIQLSEPVTREQMHALDKEVEQLKNKILAVKYANTCMESDIKQADWAYEKMVEMDKQMKAAKNKVREAGISDMKATLAHCFGQIKAFKKNEKEMESMSSNETQMSQESVSPDLV